MSAENPIPWDVACKTLIPTRDGEEEVFELPLGILATVRKPQVRQHLEVVFSFMSGQEEIMYFATAEEAATAVFVGGVIAWNIDQAEAKQEREETGVRL